MPDHSNPEKAHDRSSSPEPEGDARPADTARHGKERRAAIRMLMVGSTVLTHVAGQLSGTVLDLSSGGMRVLLAYPFSGVIGDAVEIDLPDLELALAGVVTGVACVRGSELRVEFTGCTAMERALLSSAVCQVAVRRPETT